MPPSSAVWTSWSVWSERRRGPRARSGSHPAALGTRRRQFGSPRIVARRFVAVALGPEPLMLSFSRYKVQRVSDDGLCLIEPAVTLQSLRLL